ncbi:MAG: hypothetical protein ACLFVJ_20600 [Persicimonas sp.]
MVGFIVLLTACGADETSGSEWSVEEGDGSETEYGDETTVVSTPGSTETDVIVSGDPDKCVDIDGECVDLDEAKENGGQYCDDPDAQADIIVVDGEVVDVICYPPKEDGEQIDETERDEDGDAEVPQTGSGRVVTFDEETDGEPIEGDVVIEAERATIYGNGPESTILDGDLTVRSNHARVRGVTIIGDASFDINANNSALSFCKIHGNLDVAANGFSANNCQVFGDVTVSGNDATLTNIGVQGAWEINPSAECNGCYSFADENEDFVVDDDEVGEELTCDAGEGDNGGGDNIPDAGTGG